MQVRGVTYRAVVIPPCERMPRESFEKLLELARAGAWVIFTDRLPSDVPGLGRLAARQERFQKLAAGLRFDAKRVATVGQGHVVVGDVTAGLAQAGVRREPLFGELGLMCIRRSVEDGHFYFIAHRSEQLVESWTPLARPARAALVLDPLTGRTGAAALRAGATGHDGKFTFDFTRLSLDRPGSVYESVLDMLKARSKTPVAT